MNYFVVQPSQVMRNTAMYMTHVMEDILMSCQLLLVLENAAAMEEKAGVWLMVMKTAFASLVPLMEILLETPEICSNQEVFTNNLTTLLFSSIHCNENFMKFFLYFSCSKPRSLELLHMYELWTLLLPDL